jgi:hypothetical protein
MLTRLTRIQPEQDGSRQLDKGFSTDHRSSAEVSLERVERMLSTVVVGLEILTGICAGLEDVEETEEGEDAEAAEVKEGEHVDRCGDPHYAVARRSATPRNV